MIKQVIKVVGMSCGHCENAVSESVRKLNGVKKAKASSRKNEAVVEFDDTLLTLDAIKNAIKETGYDVE